MLHKCSHKKRKNNIRQLNFFSVFFSFLFGKHKWLKLLPWQLVSQMWKNFFGFFLSSFWTFYCWDCVSKISGNKNLRSLRIFFNFWAWLILKMTYWTKCHHGYVPKTQFRFKLNRTSKHCVSFPLNTAIFYHESPFHWKKSDPFFRVVGHNNRENVSRKKMEIMFFGFYLDWMDIQFLWSCYFHRFFSVCCCYPYTLFCCFYAAHMNKLWNFYGSTLKFEFLYS